MPRDHHCVLHFIPRDEAVSPLKASGSKRILGAPEAQGGARRTFPRPLYASLLLKTQGRADAQVGMGGWAPLGTSPRCLEPRSAKWASL